MRLHISVQEFHVHVHIHDDEEKKALLQKIQELQSKVTGDTKSMEDTVNAAKEGT